MALLQPSCDLSISRIVDIHLTHLVWTSAKGYLVNSIDQDQTPHSVWSGSPLYANSLAVFLYEYLNHIKIA